MDFEKKVKAMSFKQIVKAMVAGLRNRHTSINMETYGTAIDGVCWGCAATNTICEIAQTKIPADMISYVGDRAIFLRAEHDFLIRFENAIDHLRTGYVESYSKAAAIIGIQPAPPNYQPGPHLSNSYSEADLIAWEESVAGLE